MTTLEKILAKFKTLADRRVEHIQDEHDSESKELQTLLLLIEWETADGIAREHLQDDGSVILSSWSIEDVICKNDGKYELTEDEAKEILANVKKRHDAEVGINWDVIQDHIEDFVAGRGRE